MWEKIDNVSHPLMVLTRDLLSSAGRLEHGQFIIDDTENIEQAIRAGVKIKQIFFYGERAETYEDFLKKIPKSISLYSIRPRTCKKIFSVEKYARVFAIADMPKPKPLSLFSSLQGDIVTLDGLMMTGNIGAIIRSSLAFEAGAMVLLNLEHHALFDRRLIRASKGYVFKQPIICSPSNDFFQYCKNNQVKILNCTHEASEDISTVASYSGRLAIVLGAEKKGVSEETKKYADFQAKIPFNNYVESLNVSVAAAIVLYARYIGTR